ncbi:putative lipoyltransferase-like protein, chloroplastic, partial [Tetrabaena socialis]
MRHCGPPITPGTAGAAAAAAASASAAVGWAPPLQWRRRSVVATAYGGGGGGGSSSITASRGSLPQRQPRGVAVGAAAGAVAAAAAGGLSYDPRVVVVYDMSEEVVDYEKAWEWQRLLLARASAAADAGARGSRHALLLLQHPPTYTLGAGSTTDHLRFPPGASPIPLHRTERGGEVTYHGPGQLVMYPIVDLQALTPDLHWYLRQLEQVVIEALDSVSGLRGERLEGLTGVWVGGAKVAAIGVRAK